LFYPIISASHEYFNAITRQLGYIPLRLVEMCGRTQKSPAQGGASLGC